MKTTFIITAGGIGSRMGSEVPKQFLEINGLPILIHTLKNIYEFNPEAQLIVTLPKNYFDFWKELLVKNGFQINHELVEGGRERYHSIQNALEIATGDFIAIHDGVRPFVSHSTMERLFENLSDYEAVIPVVSMKESIRKITTVGSEHVDRKEFKTVQTPQCFTRDVIIKAYQQKFNTSFTDDASIVEATGKKIKLIEGNEENIKITSPLDLLVAKSIMKSSIE